MASSLTSSSLVQGGAKKRRGHSGTGTSFEIGDKRTAQNTRQQSYHITQLTASTELSARDHREDLEHGGKRKGT